MLLLAQLKAFAQTLELASGQLQSIREISDTARIELKNYLLAAQARARYLLTEEEKRERRTALRQLAVKAAGSR